MAMHEIVRATHPQMLYHGTRKRVAFLEPNIPIWWDSSGVTYKDSDHPVLCATGDFITAGFMAVIPSDRSGFAYTPRQDVLHFRIPLDSLDEVVNTTGYIAVLGADGFYELGQTYPDGWRLDRLPRVHEWRSDTGRVAKNIIPVTGLQVIRAIHTSPNHDWHVC